MLRIGLTGGIGSGKTTVARIFEVLGVPVYYADDASKRIMETEDEIRNGIIEIFGKEAYIKGRLNRPFIASIAFHDQEKLNQLNAIVHPATLADAVQWMSTQTGSYLVKEAALIFESGAEKLLDKVIGVTAPLEMRIQRVMVRDSISREKIEARMKGQMDEQQKIALCDYVITNDETTSVLSQVLELHKTFCGIA